MIKTFVSGILILHTFLIYTTVVYQNWTKLVKNIIEYIKYGIALQ